MRALGWGSGPSPTLQQPLRPYQGAPLGSRAQSSPGREIGTQRGKELPLGSPNTWPCSSPHWALTLPFPSPGGWGTKQAPLPSSPPLWGLPQPQHHSFSATPQGTGVKAELCPKQDPGRSCLHLWAVSPLLSSGKTGERLEITRIHERLLGMRHELNPHSNPLRQRSPTFLAPGRSFVENSFSTDLGGEWFRVDSRHDIYRALYFYLYYMSSTLRSSGVTSRRLGTLL